MVLAARVAAASKPWLGAAQQQWLSRRGPLTLGIALPDHPPLAMVDAERFQGITADYLGLLFPNQVRFKTYASRAAALDALRRGEVDLLCAGTALEAARAGLLRSVPYLPSQPVLVSATDAPFDPLRPGTRLAMTANLLLRSQVAAAYPRSELLTYESPRRALEALSLGEIDGFVGDTVSVHYLIRTNYLLNLQVQSFTPIESPGFGFLLAPEDTQLRSYIDQALPLISAQHGDDILRSWSGGRRLLSDDNVMLTPAEQRWLNANPVIPVALNGSMGSLGQVDADGQAQGIGPDYLELIGRRTGLQFAYQTARNYLELQSMLGSGRALLTPAFTPPPHALPHIETLAPYLRSSVVVMARASQEAQRQRRAHHLQDLAGQRIAIVAGFFLEETVRREHPAIRLQTYADLQEALASVVAGQSDAFLGNDYAARYVNAQQFGSQLQLTGILDDYLRPVSLAMHAGSPELRSILEKAQLSIPPEEVADIVHHWAPRYPAGAGRFWHQHGDQLRRLAVGLALATAISLVWGLSLSRQIRRTRRAERRAEAANQAKSLFLSTTSHEIRTPLSAILGLLELAQDKARLGLSNHQTLAAAQKAAQGMLLLLGNVLDLHRIESGHIDSSPQAVALRPLIEDMAPLLQGMAHGKQLTLRTEVGPGADQCVTADPLHLKQVLFNLLSNAVKFTERGSVTLRAQGECRHGRLLLQLEVQDTGIGISAQDQVRLFQPYTQVDAAQRDQAFGSGLGLSITRRLVEHMGGTIAVDSTPGQGSCFTVRLSLPMAEAVPEGPADGSTQPAPPPATASFLRQPGKLRILAVEDYLFNRELIASQLAAIGHRATVAGDGLQAWERCQTEAFDLVITDGRMPYMDGAELTQRLRAQQAEGQRGFCRIIALTASADPAETQRYLDAGADEVLCKPATMHDLLRVTTQAAEQLRQTPMPPALSPA